MEETKNGDNQSGRGTQGSGDFTMQPESGQNVPLGVQGGVSGGDAVTPPTPSANSNETQSGTLTTDPDAGPTGSPTAPGDPKDSGAPAG